jgi:hypothetical protein
MHLGDARGTALSSGGREGPRYLRFGGGGDESEARFVPVLGLDWSTTRSSSWKNERCSQLLWTTHNDANDDYTFYDSKDRDLTLDT